MRKGVFCLVLLFLVSVSFAEEPTGAIPSPKEKCPVCGMFVSLFPDWNARVEFKDSTYAIFDGAKDMFKYYLDIKNIIRQRAKMMLLQFP